MLTSSIQTSIESQHFTCSCQPTFYPMLARASLLARGRSGPDQRYSSARARNQMPPIGLPESNGLVLINGFARRLSPMQP